MTMAELKQCPYCNDDTMVAFVPCMFGRYCVGCYRCHLLAPIGDTKEEAAEKWNRWAEKALVERRKEN